MAEEEGGRRAKRRCARKYTSTAMPSAIHYVGYVEDDETPEMIMAKFVELERIQVAGGHAKVAAMPAADSDIVAGDAPGSGADVVTAKAADVQQQQQQQHQPQQEQQECRNQYQQPDAAAAVAQQQKGAAAPAAVVAAVAALGQAREEGLTDEQLLEVFKQTSMFNVRSALQDNQMLMGIDEYLDASGERYAAEEALSDDDDMLRAFWSDEDDVQLSDSDEDGSGRRNRRRNGGGGGLARKGSGMGRPGPQRNAGGVKARHNVVTAFNPITQALVRRKVRVGSVREEVYHLRVPTPAIPVSWGRTVQPYVPLDRRSDRQMAVPVPPALLKAMEDGGRGMDIAAIQQTVYREECSIPETDWGSLLAAATAARGGYQAALINTGWECPGRGDDAVQRLAKLPMRRLVPKGFVFVFVAKQHVQALCRQMRAWGYCYIENLTWVYLRPNNSILELPSPYLNSSHLTLYMFRREGEGKDIELRHQRNPDVTFDCLVSADVARRSVPDETFTAIETLLPTGKGKFLELWAPQGVRRPGWSHVVEAATAAGC